MNDPDLEHLADHVSLITSTLELRDAGSDPAAAHILTAIGTTQARIQERERAQLELAAARLARSLSLTSTERYAVWLLVAVAIRGELRAVLGRRSGDPNADPTLDTIRTVIHGEAPTRPGLRELAADGALRRFGVIERSDGGGPDVHETRQTWAISRRVLALLHGDDAIDPSLAQLCRRESAGPALDALAVAPDAAAAVRRALATTSAVIVASGMPGLGRRTLLAAAAREAGLGVLAIEARELAKEPAALERQLRAIARECQLRGLVPLIANLDALVDEADRRIAIVGTELVALLDGLVLVTCGVQRPAIRWARSRGVAGQDHPARGGGRSGAAAGAERSDLPVIAIELGQPTSAQRATLWQAALGQGTEHDAELLASHYPLAPALIRRAAEAAAARAGGQPIQPGDIYGGIRAVLDERLGQYARRLTVTQTWDDLVLPADQLDAIIELMARIRERRRVYEDWGFAAKVGKGLGVSALFSGPPGTGKTMVAALIARDLQLEIYQVDLAKVVSKWIGETERNLAALFDAAEAGHAIVLFDEADALFGKRTEVKSSTDRYANLETNYLLQRLESFTGVCLLTSNHEAHIDPAFQRRLSVHLRFELPDLERRAQLWRAMLPAAAPTAPDLDFGGLAGRYALSGGYIRNAALRAGFLAANDGTPIDAVHLERAARLECEAMGKVTIG